MENDNESRDVFGDSRKRYRCPQAEIGKYGPRKEAIRLQDSSLCPLEKKYNLEEVIRVGINMAKEKNIRLP